MNDGKYVWISEDTFATLDASLDGERSCYGAVQGIVADWRESPIGERYARYRWRPCDLSLLPTGGDGEEWVVVLPAPEGPWVEARELEEGDDA